MTGAKLRDRVGRESRFDSSKGPPRPLKPGVCRWCGKSVENRRRSWHRSCALDYLRDKGKVRPFALDRNRREHDGELTCEGFGIAAHVPLQTDVDISDIYYTEVHVDHRVPLYLGGTNAADNLQVLCVSCHKRKTRADMRRGRLAQVVKLEEFG